MISNWDHRYFFRPRAYSKRNHYVSFGHTSSSGYIHYVQSHSCVFYLSTNTVKVMVTVVHGQSSGNTHMSSEEGVNPPPPQMLCLSNCLAMLRECYFPNVPKVDLLKSFLANTLMVKITIGPCC